MKRWQIEEWRNGAWYAWGISYAQENKANADAALEIRRRAHPEGVYRLTEVQS